uniref:ARID DNA-binding domain-containing protein n=1 Tax=Tanacetum cinerariifolium TaxID=118510 RepID=A0A699HSI1_TANCI|nr:ARID DNA-binding domain-containing protein [Tanacetum cinerariifolium]
MANPNTLLDDRWSKWTNLKPRRFFHSNSWYQSKPGRPLRKRMQHVFIERQLKGEKEARLGKCIKQITYDCKEMLKRKMEEIELYNSTINQLKSHHTFRRHKCFKCKQKGHSMKTCPMMKQKEEIERIGNMSETAKENMEGLMASKPTVSIKYPESIHFETKCMLKGTDQGHWDNIWYVSINTNMHLCSKFSLFYNIREKFIVNKLDDQKKFLFTYGLGEVVINNGDKGYLIPGVSYAPEVTLNILSLELLEKKGFEIMYENNTCSSLVYVFKDPKGQSFNEDRLRVMHNKYLEEYFEALDGEILGLTKQDGEEIKRCYINYLDIFTSYYKTARVPNQDQRSNLDISARSLEVGKGYTHQWDFGERSAPNLEVASKKGKEKLEHFGVKLEEENEYHDRKLFHPMQPNKRSIQYNDIKIKEEETSSTSIGSTIDEGNEVSGSEKFKKDVEEYMKTLVEAFNKIGVKGLEEFVPPLQERTHHQSIIQKIKAFFGI